MRTLYGLISGSMKFLSVENLVQSVGRLSLLLISLHMNISEIFAFMNLILKYSYESFQQDNRASLGLTGRR